MTREELPGRPELGGEHATRRRLLTVLGATGAASLMAVGSGRVAEAGHDGTNVLHLGEHNAAPPETDGVTLLSADAVGADGTGSAALDVRNTTEGQHACGVRGWSRSSALSGNGQFDGAGVTGVSLAGDGFTYPPDGAGQGVSGSSGSGFGVHGQSWSGPGVGGVSETESGVVGRRTSTEWGGEAGSSAGVFGAAENGYGVFGEAAEGSGLYGRAVNGVGVQAHCQNGPAVLAFGGTASEDVRAPGVRGLGFTDHGVVGETEHPGSAGVFGVAERCLERGPCPDPALGTGVLGRSENGIGVRGESTGGPGIEAYSERGLALRVTGTAGFATAATSAVQAGESSVAVADGRVTESSHITVTLTSDPGPRTLHWVNGVRAPGSPCICPRRRRPSGRRRRSRT